MQQLLIALIAAAALTGLSLVVMYNRFARQRVLIETSWSVVDVELTRRHELIPNLVRTVQGYAAHERAVLEELTRTREAAAELEKQPPDSRGPIEEKLGRALATVLARVEAYPDLKASSGFLALQGELVDTEDRIAASRRFYNLNVGAYNTRARSFPSNLVATWFGFAVHPFFELSDAAARTAPQVDTA